MLEMPGSADIPPDEVGADSMLFWRVSFAIVPPISRAIYGEIQVRPLGWLQLGKRWHNAHHLGLGPLLAHANEIVPSTFELM